MKIRSKALKETADASRGKHAPLDFLINGVLLILFFGGIYLLLGFLAIGISEYIPDSMEKKLTRINWLKGELEGPDTKELSMAKDIFSTLIAEEMLRELDYRLITLAAEEPNAFAFPGGVVGLTQGLLEQVKTEEGLAFVLAHEIGHHEHRHIIRSMSRGILLTLFFILIGQTEGAEQIMRLFSLGEVNHSQGQEMDADQYALDLVDKLYGVSTNSLEFFEFIQEEQPDQFWHKYLSTHPLTQDRIDAIKNRVNP